MNIQNKIPKPFRSGSCRECRSLPYISASELCPACQTFVDQDYGSQLAVLASSEDLERVSEKRQALGPDFQAAPIALEEDEPESPYAVSILTRAGLSALEKKIIKLVFLEQLTHDEVSQKLKITRGSIGKVVRRAREKLEICLARALLSKGTDSFKRPSLSLSDATLTSRSRAARASAPIHLNVEPVVATSASTEMEVSESQSKGSLRRVCPRCGDRAFCADRDFQYCFNCLWDSDSSGSMP
jgi:predicted DNA-binding protein (UPF0251 family)